MHRAYKFRLYPTSDQARMFTEWAGAVRFVYNLALEQRRDWWRQYRANVGTVISFPSQCAELTELRRDCDWLREAPRVMLEQGLRDLDSAFQAYFQRKKSYPRFRTRDRHLTFRNKAKECGFRTLNAKWGTLKLPKCAPVKLRLTRKMLGTPKTVTVKCAAGKWFAVIGCEIERAQPTPALPCVGIDRGVANTLCLSNGETHRLTGVSAAAGRRRTAQRRLARCKKGSRRRDKAKAIFMRASAKAANIRAHWLHERSTDISRRFGVIAMEALNIQAMTGAGRHKRGLNRSILEQGWAIFASMLEYKMAERGGQVFYVNPAYTSQTCSECGSVNSESRKSQAVFHCVDCGHRAHADMNAAINILRRSPAGVEGAGYGPVEAQTGEMLTHLENLAA